MAAFLEMTLRFPMRVCSRVRGHNVKVDGEVVGNAAGQDEEVPLGVEERQSVESEKDDAQGISHAAGAESEQPVPANSETDVVRDGIGEEVAQVGT